MKKTKIIYSFLIMIILFFPIESFGEQQGKELNFNKIVSERFKSRSTIRGLKDEAIKAIDMGLHVLGKLLKTTKTQSTDTINKWKEISNKYFGWWDNCMNMIKLKAKKKKINLLKVLIWRKEHDAFLNSLKNDGIMAMTWIQRANIQIRILKSALFQYPIKEKKWKKDMQEVIIKVNRLSRLMKTSLKKNPIMETINKSIKFMSKIKKQLDNLGYTMVSFEKRIKYQFSKIPKLSPKIDKLISNWNNLSSNFPNVRQNWKLVPAQWVNIIKLRWKLNKKLRTRFAIVYKPFFSGKIFDSIEHFKNLKYNELSKPVDQLIIELHMLKKKTEITVRRAIKRERLIVRKENKRIREIRILISPSRERRLKNASKRLLNSKKAKKIKSILSQLNSVRISQMEPGHARDKMIKRLESAKKAKKELDLKLQYIKKTYNDFKAEKKLLLLEHKKILRMRLVRKNKLGILK